MNNQLDPCYESTNHKWVVQRGGYIGVYVGHHLRESDVDEHKCIKLSDLMM